MRGTRLVIVSGASLALAACGSDAPEAAENTLAPTQVTAYVTGPPPSIVTPTTAPPPPPTNPEIGPEPGSSDASDTTAPDDGDGCTHKILAGQAPGSVAATYGISFDELQAANPDRDFTEWFLTGAEINIPADGDC